MYPQLFHSFQKGKLFYILEYFLKISVYLKYFLLPYAVIEAMKRSVNGELNINPL